MPVQPRPVTVSAGAVVKKLAPGKPGTQRLLERFGATLVCVRYREAANLDGTKQRLTTVEIVVDERRVKPKTALVRIGYGETRVRQVVKDAGGTWEAERRLWRLPLRSIKQLHLEARIVPEA
jgi:hypothetical protein